MASLRTLSGTKNFIACFTDGAGRRRQRSTGTHVRKDAGKVAEQFEDAARKVKTEAQIRRVLSDLFEQVSGSPLPSASVRTFLTGWAERKMVESADATASKYRSLVKAFIAHLGPRADLDLGYLTPADVLGFRDALAKRVGTATVNGQLKVLRVALNAARRAGLMATNPAGMVDSLKRKGTGTGGGRRAFTLPELSRILDVADDEWRGLIAFGIYTGARLGDLARLTWANLDLTREEVRFVTQKTNRQTILPLVRPLLGYLLSLPVADDPRQPVFTRAFRVVSDTGKVGALSNGFYNLLVSAGLAAARTHKRSAAGKGRAAKREQSEISFHALRHTSTSLLKNAGVSDVVAREFVGHESAAVSKTYTHIETATLRAAGEKLPDILTTRPKK